MKKCPNCGKEFADDFLFCDNCGAMLEAPGEAAEEAPTTGAFDIDSFLNAHETAAEDAAVSAPEAPAEPEIPAAVTPDAFIPEGPAQDAAPGVFEVPDVKEDAPAPAPQKGKKEKSGSAKLPKLGKKGLIAAAAAIVVIIVIVALIAGGGKKNSSLPLAGKSLGLYIKDGEINFTNLSGKPVQMSQKLAKQNDNEDLLDFDGYYAGYTRFSNDGKYLFFPDKLGNIYDGSFDLYVKAVNDSKGEPKKIGANVDMYEVSEDGKFVLFLDSNDKLMLYNIAKESCETVAKNVSDFRYTDDFKSLLYRSDDTWYLILNGKDKEKVGDGSLSWVSDDFKTVLLKDDDELISKTAGKDKEKLLKDVYGGVKTHDLKHIYYLSGERGDLTLCYYNGKESTELVEKIDHTETSLYNTDTDTYVYIYANSKDKIMCALISGGKLVTEESMGKMDGVRYSGFMGDKAFYIVTDDNKLQTYNITGKGFSEGSISAKNVDEVYYRYDRLFTYNYEKGSISVDGEAFTKDITEMRFMKDALYYADDYSAKHGTSTLHMWKDGKITDIAEDVWYFTCSNYVDGTYYFTDFDEDDGTATLNSYIGGKTTEAIAEDVYLGAGYCVTPDGGFLFLTEYNTKRYEGDLYYCSGKKAKKLDEDVCAILSINY